MTAFLATIAIWSLRSTVIVAVGALLQLFIRRRSAATRNLVWRTTLACVALVPALMLIVPAVEAPITAPAFHSVATTASKISPAGVPLVDHLQAQSPILNPPSDGNNPNPIVAVAIYTLYLLGVIVCLARWIRGINRVKKLLTDAQSGTFGLPPTQIWIARHPMLSVPVTCGWRSPVILLPAKSADWPPAILDAAIAHETAHISRRDWAFQSLVTILVALQWFNPAIWLAAARMTATAEEAADDAVLRYGIQPSSYARALLDVAAGLSKPAQPGVAMVRTVAIAKRLNRVIAPNVDRSSPSRLVFSTLTLLILLTAGMASALRVSQSNSTLLAGDWDTLFYSAPPTIVNYLDGGIETQLSMLGDVDANKRVRSWAPDGRAMPPPPGPDIVFGLREEDTDMNPHEKRRNVGIVFRFKNLPRDPTVHFVNRGGVKTWSDLSAFSWPTFPLKVDGGALLQSYWSGNSELRAVVNLPSSLTITDIDLGIAYEPGSMLYRCKISDTNLVLRTSEFHPEGMSTMSRVSRIFLAAPDRHTNMDYQAVVHLKDGEAQSSYGASDGTFNVDGKGARSFDFFGCYLKDIVSVDLLERPIHWVKFNRIKLYPRDGGPR